MVQRLTHVVNELQRLRFVVRVRVLAALKRSTVDVAVERGVRFAGPIGVTIHPRTSSSVSIGRGTRIGRNVHLILDGGSMTIGRRAFVRTGVIVHVRGSFVMEDRTLLSYYSVVHCDESVVIRHKAALGEHLTIIDSHHLPAEGSDWWVNRIETAPVEIGEEVWGGSKVTVTSGVTVGAGSILAAGAVVGADVPDDTIVGGVPARVIGTSNLRANLR